MHLSNHLSLIFPQFSLLKVNEKLLNKSFNTFSLEFFFLQSFRDASIRILFQTSPTII